MFPTTPGNRLLAVRSVNHHEPRLGEASHQGGREPLVVLDHKDTHRREA